MNPEKRSKHPALFFSKKEKERIVNAIQEAERATSGEIRVHLARRARPDIEAHARELFVKLGMTETAARNGVLILIGIASRRFVVLGDRGIHEKVPPDFWNDVVETMKNAFRENRFADGLAEGILRIGEKLRDAFPHQRDDINELPDEISFSV